MSSVKPEEVTDIEVEEGGSKDSIGFKFKHVPKKADTGVDEAITRLSAAMSGQLYCAQKIEDFDLSQKDLKVDAVLFDTHGPFIEFSPYFGVAVTGNIMVIGWRGTADIMNMISDVNATPATSKRWAHISSDIKVHGGFHPIVEDDLTTHESTLIALMEKHGITELITTGHSLGGALGTVAHIAIEGELTKDKSIWKAYAEKLKSQGKVFKVRAIAFSAPTSVFNIAAPNNAAVNAFLKKVESNSCNIIYSTDPVPRAPGFMEFIDELANELIPEKQKQIRDKFGIVAAVGKRFVNAMDAYNQLKESQKALLEAVQISRHYCKIIFYEHDAAVPIVLKDYGKGVTGEPDGIKSFRSIRWQETPDVEGVLMHNHNITVRGPGLAYNIDEGKTEVKLYHMHNRSLMEDAKDVATVRVNGWEDCRKKAKEHFVYAYMGGYVDWDDEPKNLKPHERGGLLHVKENIARESDDAEWVKRRGFFGTGTVKHTALWRTPALADKVALAEEAKKAGKVKK